MRRTGRWCAVVHMILLAALAACQSMICGCHALAGEVLAVENLIAVADDGRSGLYAVTFDPADPPHLTKREQVYRLVSLSPDLMVQADLGTLVSRREIERDQVRLIAAPQRLYIIAHWRSGPATPTIDGEVWAKPDGEPLRQLGEFPFAHPARWSLAAEGFLVHIYRLRDAPSQHDANWKVDRYSETGLVERQTYTVHYGDSVSVMPWHWPNLIIPLTKERWLNCTIGMSPAEIQRSRAVQQVSAPSTPRDWLMMWVIDPDSGSVLWSESAHIQDICSSAVDTTMRFAGNTFEVISNDTAGIVVLAQYSATSSEANVPLRRLCLVSFTPDGRLERAKPGEATVHLAAVDHVARPQRRMVYPVGGKAVGYRVLEMDAAGRIASREYRIP